jgi:hypothetical protein
MEARNLLPMSWSSAQKQVFNGQSRLLAATFRDGRQVATTVAWVQVSAAIESVATQALNSHLWPGE